MNIYCFFCHQSFKIDNSQNTTVIAIDVLRATSTIINALDNGAGEVIPIAEIADALALKKTYPDAILSGERKGNIIEGFQLGNSPLEFTAENIGGRRIISCTTNGTSAICAAQNAGALWLGAITNAPAVAQKLLQKGKKRVVLLCSGTCGQPSLDDVLGAGAIISHLLPDAPHIVLSDAARIALEIYKVHEHDLWQGLLASKHGRKLQSIGYEKDLLFCSQLGHNQVVPYLEKGILRK